MHNLKAFVILLLPLLVLGGPQGDKGEPSWEAGDDFTLNPKAKDDSLAASQSQDKSYLPESQAQDGENETGGDEETEEEKPVLPAILKRLIEQEMLKRSEEDKLPKTNNDSQSQTASSNVKTPLTYMTPPPPPEDEDLSTTTGPDSTEDSDEETSTTTESVSPDKTELLGKSSEEAAFPPEADNTRIVSESQETRKPSPPFKPEEDDESPNSEENEITRPYAKRFTNFQSQPQQTRLSEDQEEPTKSEENPKEPSKVSEDPEESHEFESYSTQLPPTEDSTEITEPDQQEVAPPPPAPETSNHQPSRASFVNNGMDKVIFDREESPSEEDASSGAATGDSQEPPREKYYFFLQPRPTPPPLIPTFQQEQPYPSSLRYPQQSVAQLPYTYNPYFLRPVMNYPSSSIQSVASEPSLGLMSQQPQMIQPQLPSSSFQFQRFQPQQQMFPSGDDDFANSRGMKPSYASFPTAFSPPQRPQMNFFSPPTSSGLGFSGDYLRNPYFWSNPYSSFQAPQYQRIPTAPLYYAF